MPAGCRPDTVVFRSAVPFPATAAGRRRHQDIMRSATRLFAVRGYHSTRMDEVADAVGVNKPSLYHYYPSKSLLLYDILRQVASATMPAVRPVPNCVPPLALKQCTANLTRVVAANPNGAAVYLQESPFIAEWLTEDQVDDIRAAEDVIYERVRNIIENGIATGDFRDCDSHILALGHVSLTLGSHRWLTPNSSRSADDIAAGINRMALRGLSPDTFKR